MEILLVEDDDRIVDFVSRGLRAEGYAVSVAQNGPDGLQAACDLARRLAADGGRGVVVLDRMLPELDGMAVCQALRARGCDVPVLMLTALGATAERIDGLRRGADDYLPKPFDFDELLARIEALTRRGPMAAQTRPASVGGVVIDRDLPGLRSDAAAVALTARELALLELLAGAPGRILSRATILARVWGADRDPLTNVVDVYASRLRAKLGQVGSTARLEGVRGLGYRLSDGDD
jgi:DNA-binding response OmpR family regulator